MATTQRHADFALGKQLFQALQANDDFFQLVRLLERQHRAGSDEAGRVGSDCAPAQEPVRFHATNHLGFPTRALDKLWQEDASGESHGRHHLAVNFMGLTGPTGVLPRHYTTLIQERAKQRDHALAEFLDLFNHRLISLFYRAWAKYCPAVQYEDHADGATPPPLSVALRAFAGQSQRQRDDTALYYSGHFSRTNRPASGLARLLADYLEHRVEVESFVGQWLPIHHCDRAVIGGRGRNHRLGDGVLIGARVWDVQSKFRVVIGPLTEADHEALLPGTDRFQQLSQLVRQYAPSHLNIEVKFLVRPSTQPRDRRKRFRLGRNAWLGRGLGGVRSATLQLR